MPRPPSDAPGRILDAATHLLQTVGPSALSFDRLAASTGLSKGGVLHHFRTREALVQGMITRLLDRLGREIETRAEQDGDPVGAYRRAYCATLLAAAEHRQGVQIQAALLVDPKLLTPVWAFLEDARRRVASELGPTDAIVLCGAVEARWWTALLGGPPLDRTSTLQLRARTQDWYR